MLFMPTADHQDGFFGPLVRRFREWKEERQNLAAFDLCGRGETARMAHDLSLTTRDLRALARKGARAAALLYRRLADLDLDRAVIARREAGVLRDMQKTCALCASKGRCRRDLARFAPLAEWEGYCPNDDTLRTLLASDAYRAAPGAASAALAAAGTADGHREVVSSLFILLLVTLTTLALFALQPFGSHDKSRPVEPAPAPGSSAIMCLDATCLTSSQRSALLDLRATLERGLLAASRSQLAAMPGNARIAQTVAAAEATACSQRGGASYYGFMVRDGCTAGARASAWTDGYKECLPMAGGGVCLTK